MLVTSLVQEPGRNIKGVLWLGFGAALIAATAVAYAARADSNRYYYWSDWISHTQTVLDTIEEERVELFNALTALATFYQTGENHTLDELAGTISKLRTLSIQLRNLTRDNQRQQARLDRFDSILRSLTAPISPQLPTETTESIKAPTAASIAVAFTELRQQLSQMSSEEHGLLKERLAGAQTSSRRSIATMMVGGSLVFVWLLLVSGYAQLTGGRLRESAQNLARFQRQLIRAGAQRRADELFRKIIQSAQDAMVIVGKGGRIVLVNEQAERLYGYTRSELLGMKAEMLSPARLRAEYRADPRLRSPGSAMEFCGVRKDGVEFPVEVSVGQIELEDSTVICMALRDITERKKIEQALRESEERYRLLVENVEDYAIFMLDDEGCVISWNEGAQRMTAYAAEEIVGRDVSCFFPPEDVAIGNPARERIEARERGKCETEGWRTRKDGSRIWVNSVITALYGPDGRFKASVKSPVTSLIGSWPKRNFAAYSSRRPMRWLSSLRTVASNS